MGTILKIAFRNVFRFKRRSIITFSTVSLGLTLLIGSMGFLDGLDKQGISTLLNTQTSHLTIFSRGYFEKRDELPLNLTIKEPGPIHALVQTLPGVRAAESRIRFIAGLIKGMDELPCQGVAIEPGRDPQLFRLKDSLVEGSWLEPGDAGVLVGKNLAQDIKLSVGDPVSVRMITSSKGEDLSWNVMDLEVKGIFDTGNPTVDSQWLIMPLAWAREGLSLGSGVTEILLRLNEDDEEQMGRTRARLQEMLKKENSDLEVFSWRDLSAMFLAISEVKSRESAMIVVILLLVAAVGIINTMLMAVMERTREIGMLSAMGMKRVKIMGIFVFEGGIIGIFGSLLGCILGGLINWYLSVYGMSIRELGEVAVKVASSIWPVKDVIYSEFSPGFLVFAFVLGTVISIAASAYPAAKAAKMDPVKALRAV